jgi:hypothetical protein
MSNILKTIDLTDRAIRRAVFAVLDGLANSQPVWPRTRQRNWAPNHHDALHRLLGILECGRSEEGRRRVVRACLTNTRRLLDGTCEQLFSRFLFLAAVNFQKREYAEHEDRQSHNAEQRPAARRPATHHKDVSALAERST